MSRRWPRLVLVALVALGSTSMSGCAIHMAARVCVVDTAPPAPLAEATPPPRPGHVWVAGRWELRAGTWRWEPGRWQRDRGESYVWVNGFWLHTSGRWHWVDGHWQLRDAQASAAPR